jgi:integrase
MKSARRSRPGDGSVYPSKGKWVAAISLGGRDRRRYRRVTAETKAEALEALRRLRAERAPLAVLERGEVTVETYLRTWLEESVRPPVRDTTFATYESVLRNHVYPVLGPGRLDRLTRANLVALFADLERAGVGARLREVVHQRLKAALAAAVGRAFAVSPMTSVPKPRVPRRAMSTWSAEEARAFLEATAGDEFAALWRLALSIGARRGELLALRTVDFDRRARKLHVQHTLSAAGELREPKTRGARRAIDLPDRAAAALVAHRERLLAAGLGGALWLFPAEDGPRRGQVRLPRAVSAAFERAIERAGVPRIRFHDLRHTCATLRLANGDHPKVVSEMLGHASIQITLDTYSHVLPSLQREAADRFDGVL